MLFRLEQFSNGVDLGFLFLCFRIACSICGKLRRNIEVLWGPIALPRGVYPGVSCPCAIQTLQDDRRRRAEIA